MYGRQMPPPASPPRSSKSSVAAVRRGHRLPTVRTEDGFTARLDDEELPDGVYDLRARAIDGAGNERSTDREPSGEKARRTAPMRIATRLVAGHVKLLDARRSDGAGAVGTSSSCGRQSRTGERSRSTAA